MIAKNKLTPQKIDEIRKSIEEKLDWATRKQELLKKELTDFEINLHKADNQLYEYKQLTCEHIWVQGYSEGSGSGANGYACVTYLYCSKCYKHGDTLDVKWVSLI
jgi:hypothetical protein